MSPKKEKVVYMMGLIPSLAAGILLGAYAALGISLSIFLITVNTRINRKIVVNPQGALMFINFFATFVYGTISILMATGVLPYICLL